MREYGAAVLPFSINPVKEPEAKPAAITHCLQSRRVLAEVQKEEPSFSVAEEAYLWGAQGPEFFACHRFLPWWKGESLVKFGDRLHSAPPAETLAAMWAYVNERPKDVYARSYAAGFLCHYAADSICHPYVESRAAALHRADPSQEADVYHNEIESALDLIILRYERAALPSEFPLKRTVPHHPAAERSIARLYASLIGTLFGARIPEEKLLECLEDCRKIFSLLTDRTGLKKNLMERLEKKKARSISCHLRGMTEEGNFDYANTLLETWRWPPVTGAPRNESFFELYESSVPRAAELILEAPDCLDFAVLTENLPFI